MVFREGKIFFYNRDTFSKQDLVQINRKYQCSGKSWKLIRFLYQIDISDSYLNMASEMNPQEPQIIGEKKDRIEETICEDRKSLGYKANWLLGILI